MADSIQPANGTKLAQANATKVQSRVSAALASNWAEIAKVLPQGFSETEFKRLAISTLNQSPRLKECDPASVLFAIQNCVILGLKPGNVDGLGRCWIIPYKGKAQFQLGYRGMIELARRSGEIKSIACDAVYTGDVFSYQLGTCPQINHVPALGVPHTKVTLEYVYMVAEYFSGMRRIQVVDKAEIEQSRRRSRAGDEGPWVTDYIAMALKTAIRRAEPWLPLSEADRRALIVMDYDGPETGTVAVIEATGDATGKPEALIPLEAVAEVMECSAGAAQDAPGTPETPDTHICPACGGEAAQTAQGLWCVTSCRPAAECGQPIREGE